MKPASLQPYRSTQPHNYTLSDHLGNARVSFTDSDSNGIIDTSTNSGEILQTQSYYPFGLVHSGVSSPVTAPENMYQYNGKEYQSELGIFDYGARNYDPTIGRWGQVDPLAESMPTWSPYNFTFNNPIRFIDPDGMSPDDVIITGEKSKEALAELQKSVNSELTLSMHPNGQITYLQKDPDATLSSNAQQLVDAIDDSSITVNVTATDNDFISDNSAPLLGAFMGNHVGPTHVNTFQEINPEALGNLDQINESPGQSTLHEVLESYFGGKISQKTGVSVGKATSDDANNPKSVYRRAHDNVVPQSGTIYEHFYDSSGTEIFRGDSNFSPVKLKYSTGSPQEFFHTIPKEEEE